MKRDVFKRPLEKNSGGKTRRERPSGDTVAADPVKTIRRREAAAAGSASRSEGGRATRIVASGGLDDRATLMALPVAVYRTDPDGRIAFFNRAAAELWGHEPAAGSLWCGALRRYRPDGGPMEAGESPTRVAIRDGIALRGIETSIERPDGTRVAVLDQSTPIRDAAGRILGAITVMEAAAGRGSAVDEAQRLAAIVEGSDDAIISKTLGGIVTSWNPGAERIFGHSAQEMVGQPIARIIPEDLQEEERQILAKLARGERIDHFDTVRLSRDGRRIAISLTVSPLRDAAGAIVGASKIARDVTERKQAEDALRQATEAARQAQIEAESANRAKTEFLAVMSHEIRTPLNSISGFIDLLTSTTELTPKQRRYARLVKSANAALLTVVNDILDFSKVEAGQLELDRHVFSPANLVQDAVAIVVPTAAANNLALTAAIDPETPQWVVGDHARLRQVLLNLLNNAVKFTEKGSIRLDVRPEVATSDGRERLRFSVSDTGVGISPEQQQRLFKKFSQADSSVNRRHGGSGLGLAICKRLVELMDGEIGLVSEVGEGSTFWFTAAMPRASAPAPEAAEPALGPRGGKARILVIDDIETNLEIVEAYLEDNGYLVDCVSSGLEAIQMLGSKTYDLVLMDIQMPVMDGVAATRRIRALPPPIRDIPIIAMTGNVLPQQVRSFLDAGMNDHVGKPIERAKLYNNILRWLPRPEVARARAAAAPPAFDSGKLDEFVLVVGSAKAERIAAKFLVSLSDAFESGIEAARREAHALINTSGVFGLDGFVAACRRAMETSQSEDDGRDRAALAALVAARADARRTLITYILPRLRGATLRPAV
jgi:PAS domain S-box-containing protein